MAHRTQVLVLLHLNLQQAKEVKSQSKEIRCLSTLLGETTGYHGESPGAAEQGA